MSLAADHIGTAGWGRSLRTFLRGALILSPREAQFAVRGFEAGDPVKRLGLERIGGHFIGGYNAAVCARNPRDIRLYVDAVAAPDQGFAAEGAAMGTAIVDALSFRPRLLSSCVGEFSHDLTYLVHVGAGWAMARVPWRRKRILSALDPLYVWLAYDGLGFHDTYFSHRSVLEGWRRVRAGYAARAYDQGVGRAIWFFAGGSVSGALACIRSLPASRHPDLWAGLGLAMGYTGLADDQDVTDALENAGSNVSHFAQGVAFACEARSLAGAIPEGTQRVASLVWNEAAQNVAMRVRDLRLGLPNPRTNPQSYELWRSAIATMDTERRR